MLLEANRYDLLLPRAAEFLKQQAALREVLILAPSKGAADDLARLACEGALTGVHRATLYQWASKIAETRLAARGLAPCSTIAREALAARCVSLVAGQLKYFAPVAARPGFAKALARTLNDLRLAGVRFQDFAQHEGPCADLAVLQESFESELRKNCLADDADRYDAADVPIAHALLLLDVRPSNESERRLLATLTASSPAVLAVRLGSAPNEQPATRLHHAQTNLFAANSHPLPPDDSIDFFSASGEALETVEIARRIRKAAASGVPFDDMAILLRSPSRTQPAVEEALRRAGIPAYFAHAARRPDVAGRAFLALLYCAQEGLPAARFGEYLSLGQVPEIAGPINGWDKLIIEASVIGGAQRWERRLKFLYDQADRKYQAATDDDKSRHGAKLQRIGSLRDFALPVLQKLSHFPALANWAEWLKALESLANLTLQDNESVVDLLDQLRPLGDTGPVALLDVMQVLEEHLLTSRREPVQHRYGRVFVGSIEEARARCFQVVCLPGLNEGLFPRAIAEDPLLLNVHREQVSPHLLLADEESEKELLHVALACASEKLTASYSRLDLLTGRPRVLSLYAIEMLRAAGVNLSVRELEEHARSQTEARVGWPAPSDPAIAIDDAEFDLATLRPAFDGINAAGAAAYLQPLSKPLWRSLRARWRRWKQKWSSADGLVHLELDTEPMLEAYRLTNRAYSASALQHFAACPYRFALKAIHGLRPFETRTPLHRMDPLLRGTLFHSMQFEFLTAMKASEQLPLTHSGRHAAFQLLEATIDRVAAEAEELLAPAIEPVWESELRELRADLLGWLQDAFDNDAEWEPIAFELAFNVKLLDTYLLQGSIDLVQRHTNGALRVVDHKTGKPPSPLPQFAGKGESLQPLLYGLTAEQLMQSSVHQARLHYATIRGNYRRHDITISPFARTRIELVLRIIDDSISQGFLPAAPREKACAHCDYLPVCGPYEEERIRIKTQPEIRRLLELRNIP